MGMLVPDGTFPHHIGFKVILHISPAVCQIISSALMAVFKPMKGIFMARME